MKIAIIGAGSFGTALGIALSGQVKTVHLWSHSNDIVESITQKKQNAVYLPEIILPDNIIASSDLASVLDGAEYVLSVVPTQATREVWTKAKEFIRPDAKIVVASKGIEQKTHKLVSDIFIDLLGEQSKSRLFFLSGPSFAKELAAKKPTAITIAGYERAGIPEIQSIFSTRYFRIYGTTDVTGVELGGALKNVIAIATGISDGLQMGNNTRAALITRGLAEIARLGKSMGADPLTFMGLAGLGDLVLTCTGDLSRNRSVGLKLASGQKIADILKSMRMVAEGVTTTQSAYELAQIKGIEMPITEAVYQILYNDKTPEEGWRMLVQREPRFESDMDE
ncbi:MAG: NAD(P)H-dependent glycerol-3-phosphate dehydrogenase [Leptospirales bacterium]